MRLSDTPIITSYFEVRPSPIQGLGAFATRRIRKGTRIIEYIGERISQEEADRRYEDPSATSSHVLLFTVDKRIVIDAGVNGNQARFINHSCEPNCEAVVENKHVYIETLKLIANGEELTYDYNLTWDTRDAINSDTKYICHCGRETCRGTMLAPKPSEKRRQKRNLRLSR